MNESQNEITSHITTQEHLVFDAKPPKKTVKRGSRRKKEDHANEVAHQSDYTDTQVEYGQTQEFEFVQESFIEPEVKKEATTGIKRGRGRKQKQPEAQEDVPVQESSVLDERFEPVQRVSEKSKHSEEFIFQEEVYSFNPTDDSTQEKAAVHKDKFTDSSVQKYQPEPHEVLPSSEENISRPQPERQLNQHENRKYNQRGQNSFHAKGPHNNKFNKNFKFNKNNPNNPNSSNNQHQDNQNKPTHHTSNKPTHHKPFRQSSENKHHKKLGGAHHGGHHLLHERQDISLVLGDIANWNIWNDVTALEEILNRLTESGQSAFYLREIYQKSISELAEYAREKNIGFEGPPNKTHIISHAVKQLFEQNIPCVVEGVLEVQESGHGLLLYQNDNYKHRALVTFLHKNFINKYSLKFGHSIEVLIHPTRDNENCFSALKVLKVMGKEPETMVNVVPFHDLVPYYPTERIVLESRTAVNWDNLSMRAIDLLTPIGLGQRGIIVAPPRTGKTMLMQSISNAILMNKPNVHLIVLMIDERPEEVTDFKRHVDAEIISSTFDETADNHVHTAEVVIHKAKRMVENGQHVVILLDSITRLARAYNTMMPNSGKILSGGVEANALQWPKRFFGAARNIEGGGSLTIIGSALVETGSRMDEVIFEEFKGTGNMEVHLDRALVEKRIFPAISIDKSGTRKEELLYHPDEMQKIHSLRRAMKGVPSTEAMEMLLQRLKKTKSNAEFLMGLNS